MLSIVVLPHPRTPHSLDSAILSENHCRSLWCILERRPRGALSGALVHQCLAAHELYQAFRELGRAVH